MVDRLVKDITVAFVIIVGEKMGTLKLKASMIGTLAAIIGLSTLFLTVLLSYIGIFNLYTLVLFMVFFNVLQWLIAPFLINAMYRVKEISKKEEPELCSIVERLSRKSGIKTPHLAIARIPLPNAFAYGSPLTGNRVAVSTGLLDTLDTEEVEAVIGHELGHLKNRDVQVMMFVSILPALFYYIGYSLMWSSMYRRRDERGNAGLAVLIGFASMLFYWVLTLFTLYLSRLREYHADIHSISAVDDGARKLSEGLVKIAESTEKMKDRYRNMHNMSSLKTLFISDPDSARRDLREVYHKDVWRSDQEIVSKYLNRKVTTSNQFAELFSTHPNMVKRLRAIQETA